MPTWLIGAVRTALQAGWGYLAGWLIVHNIPVPEQAPEWLQLAVLAVIAGAVAGLVQWAERRRDTRLGRLVRALAKLLMLGARAAQYPPKESEAVGVLRSQQASRVPPGAVPPRF